MVIDGTTVSILGRPVWIGRRPGSGRKIVLLHGGLSDSRVWLPLLGALDEAADVWIYDRQGHGRTPDAAEPITYAAMLAELEAFLPLTGTGDLHVIGHSDGANLALLLAIRRSDAMASVVAISGNRTPGGVNHGHFDVEEVVASVRDDYAAIAPNGGAALPQVAAKLAILWNNEPRMANRDLGEIRCPTLIMAGDRDLIKITETIAMHEAIYNSALGIVPGTSHMLITEKPALCAQMIASFWEQ